MVDPTEPKRKGSYHHGDLRRALVAAAAGIIEEAGADALTLRGVGERVGVSRTALYRHFASKAALLASVALEGFRMLRHDLETAQAAALARGDEPLVALGEAYVSFGTQHPPHYRTMFGAPLEGKDAESELGEEGRATFLVLVNAVAAGQAAGRLRAGDPVRLAQVLWAAVHGIVTLGMDGHLAHQPAPAAGEPTLATFATRTMMIGLIVA